MFTLAEILQKLVVILRVHFGCSCDVLVRLFLLGNQCEIFCRFHQFVHQGHQLDHQIFSVAVPCLSWMFSIFLFIYKAGYCPRMYKAGYCPRMYNYKYISTTPAIWLPRTVNYNFAGGNPYDGLTGKEVCSFVANGRRMPRPLAISLEL